MSKRISKVDNIKYALSGNDRYIASIDPGETFVVECAINANDGTIRHLGQQLTEADVTFPFVNGATGPIEVRGSKAGDMLKVEIINMELDKLGFTALWPGIGMFPDWVRRKEFGIQTRVVEVKDGRVHWNGHLKLPIRPMIESSLIGNGLTMPEAAMARPPIPESTSGPPSRLASACAKAAPHRTRRCRQSRRSCPCSSG